MDDIHKSGIMTSLQSLWSSSQYSDMIVRSGSEEFKVHRAIVCPRSKFFAAACNGPFQVCHNKIRSGRICAILLIHLVQEGRTGIITLRDDDTPTVRRMLKYLYTLDYDDTGEAADVAKYAHGKGASANLQATTATDEEQSSADDPARNYHHLLNNIAVYAIADKYDIPELEALAAKKFSGAIWESTIGLDMARLRAIIDAVFDVTPDAKCDLRVAVIRFCKNWREEIFDNEDSVAIVKDYGEIGLAIIHKLLLERVQNEMSTEARIKAVMGRENTLIWHIERISRAAQYMQVLDSRGVQQNYIDWQHRRLRDLREAIQEAKEYYRKNNE